MSRETLLLQLRPHIGRLQEEPCYTGSDVKKMLFAFARDLGCKWRRDRLERFIDSAFRKDGDYKKGQCLIVNL